MGQRLVMSVYETVDAAEPLAAVYLHWSAYTISAFEEAAYLLRHLEGARCRVKEEWQKRIVEVYLHNQYPEDSQKLFPEWKGKHGGVCLKDKTLAGRLWPDLDLDMANLDSNQGLVAISPEQMERIAKLSEGDARIYLDVMAADIDVFWQTPASAWEKGEDGLWHNTEMEDDYYTIPDDVWKGLTEMPTTGLSLADITNFLATDAKKVSKDGWALADDGETVIEIIR